MYRYNDDIEKEKDNIINFLINKGAKDADIVKKMMITFGLIIIILVINMAIDRSIKHTKTTPHEIEVAERRREKHTNQVILYSDFTNIPTLYPFYGLQNIRSRNIQWCWKSAWFQLHLSIFPK